MMQMRVQEPKVSSAKLKFKESKKEKCKLWIQLLINDGMGEQGQQPLQRFATVSLRVSVLTGEPLSS
jgi:hypothetical protein